MSVLDRSLNIGIDALILIPLVGPAVRVGARSAVSAISAIRNGIRAGGGETAARIATRGAKMINEGIRNSDANLIQSGANLLDEALLRADTVSNFVRNRVRAIADNSETLANTGNLIRSEAGEVLLAVERSANKVGAAVGRLDRAGSAGDIGVFERQLETTQRRIRNDTYQARFERREGARAETRARAKEQVRREQARPQSRNITPPGETAAERSTRRADAAARKERQVSLQRRPVAVPGVAPRVGDDLEPAADPELDPELVEPTAGTAAQPRTGTLTSPLEETELEVSPQAALEEEQLTEAELAEELELELDPLEEQGTAKRVAIDLAKPEDEGGPTRTPPRRRAGTGRATRPAPVGHRPRRSRRPDLPPGDKDKRRPGGRKKFPAVLAWEQGAFKATFDLHNDRKPRFTPNKKPTGRTPRQTLRVISTSSRRPPSRRFRLGFESVDLEDLGIVFRLADDRMKNQTFPRVRRP